MQASWWVFPLHWVLWAECSLTESSSRPLCLPLSGVRLGLLWAWPLPTVHLSMFSHGPPGSGAQSVSFFPVMAAQGAQIFSIPRNALLCQYKLLSSQLSSMCPSEEQARVVATVRPRQSAQNIHRTRGGHQDPSSRAGDILLPQLAGPPPSHPRRPGGLTHTGGIS